MYYPLKKNKLGVGEIAQSLKGWAHNHKERTLQLGNIGTCLLSSNGNVTYLP